jgi:outer membrane protein assembly factor BamB
MRPLTYAQFVATEPAIVASAEHGLVCRYQLDGQQVWSDKLWNNVGQLAAAGDASLIFLACFSHGVQVYDGDGGTVGSYVLEGTASRVAVSFEPQRIFAATIERKLYWLDADGEVLWSTTPPDDIEAVACDPLGEWVICGLKCGRVYRLDWTRRG